MDTKSVKVISRFKPGVRRGDIIELPVELADRAISMGHAVELDHDDLDERQPAQEAAPAPPEASEVQPPTDEPEDAPEAAPAASEDDDPLEIEDLLD